MGRREAPYVRTADERLCWLLVIVTIPVGAVGVVLEHKLRTVFAKPTAAAVFLFVNGLILLGGERLRRRDEVRALAGASGPPVPSELDGPSRRLETLNYREGFVIGMFQSFALLAGISRSGVTMVGGLVRGLDHEDAARFSFLAATPVILAAGVYKLPDLAGHLGDGIRGQVLAGSAAAAFAAYIVGAVADALVRDADPHAVRALLPRGGRRVRGGIRYRPVLIPGPRRPVATLHEDAHLPPGRPRRA